MAIQPLHPFPARMDPEAGLAGLVNDRSDEQLTVLDPMMGSGTIPFLAALRGHIGVGFEIDPLAHLIARALALPLPRRRYLSAAERVADEAMRLQGDEPVHADEETRAFIDYWFDDQTQLRLAALARVISQENSRLRPALWCAFSRLIITKDVGASLARDVSHSRPHKVREESPIDPIARYVSAARAVESRHAESRKNGGGGGRTSLRRGDARKLTLEDASVDVIATSPPYLHAIDYLRGHRLSLVWMGHSLAELRHIRGNAIGAELASTLEDHDLYDKIGRDAAARILPPLARRKLRRYIHDIDQVLAEFTRVLKPTGTIRFVVAGATLAGIPVSIPKIVRGLAGERGLAETGRVRRKLPSSRRYLPPPDKTESALKGRVRFEQILTFAPATSSGGLRNVRTRTTTSSSTRRLSRASLEDVSVDAGAAAGVALAEV